MDRNRQAVAKSNVTEREGLYDPRTRKANPPPSVCSLGASPYAMRDATTLGVCRTKWRSEPNRREWLCCSPGKNASLGRGALNSASSTLILGGRESEPSENRYSCRLGYLDVMITRLKTTWRWHKRRLIALVVMLSVFSSVIPIPFNFQSPIKGHSQPFPCQNRPCGCRTAEQCWKKCCCFTNTQKVAWAKACGVHPPQFVVAAANREQETRGCASRTCCSKCSKHSSAAKQKTPASSVGKIDSPRHGKRDRHVTLVIGVFAQECQGQGWGWHSLPWSVLPEGPACLIMEQSQPEHCPPISDSCPKRTLKPPVPPPRQTSVAIFGV